MAAPPNSYNSVVNLRLGSVPQGIQDKYVYEDLLDVHNAIEQLAFQGTRNSESSVISFPAGTSTIEILPEYGTILVNASLGDVTVILYPPSAGIGNSHNVKQIAGTYTTVVKCLTAPVDDDVDGISLDNLEAIPVISDGVSWYIHN